jgi:mRNA interferase YafQ
VREIRRTRDFKRDYKRERSGPLARELETLVAETVAMLANDQALPDRFHDHALSGPWREYRDCHVRPDLVLIYRMPDETTLELIRLGSHSELGL